MDSARSPTTASPPWGVIGGAVIGALFFAWISGARPLDPTDVDWLMKGDWVPHHFGWHFFRAEPWQWPPGSIHGYYAPLGTSIGLTDSIPLAAYLLKPFSTWLPPAFQYLGPWLLLCFALQGALAARLIGRWSSSPLIQLLGASLFVLMPTLLARVGHAALCAHWLILWALLLVTRPSSRRFAPGAWALLGLAAGMTQPYLAAMVLPLLAVTALLGRPSALASRVGAMMAALGATVLGWWLSGLFVLQGEGSLSSGGLGYYSMNLLGPIAPGGWSRVVPEMPRAGDGQIYEGFQYLGLGTLALIALAVVLTWRTRGRSPATSVALTLTPELVAVCVLMAAFALSPRVTLGGYVLADLSGPWSAPLAAFRSSGRFFWPLAYVGLTWAVVVVATRLPRARAIAVLAVAVLVQAVDLHAIHVSRHDGARDAGFYAWPNPFASPRWAAIAPAYAHLVLVPPPQCGAAPLPYEAAVRLAAEHGLTVNAGVIARGDEGARRRYCAELDGAIDAAQLRDDSLYVTSATAAGALRTRNGANVTCGTIDGVWICTTASAYARWAAAAPFDP